ncbi:hypothetical protein QKU48_gp0914 [Fadolivirus algeromassiliense]|jgi:hypothetical protein|uniref:Uncharacterized protein n=1 Tax=Fadolivirus FV1/VV64 TaxID=3070911 RepID=A0A7D3V5V8_9VIRU|nr:hypothetical protein QKU48_gp0914 [Fadolivirus algeromassiliense]QKF94372.1 hypothetical protein Fadolivirus_1_914 [Fadolivirus FV1/VV64]
MADKFIKGENLIDEVEETSPSGKYKLIIGHYRTKEGAWNYSSGRLVRLSDNKEIITINRNYSTFHHSWFIKNNHEWIQTGSTYMSQLFVDLDTGFIYDNLEKLSQTKEYKNGASFCWTKCWINNDGNTLVVLGCYWACPYEYKFYDFSSPGKGWEELKTDVEYHEHGTKLPEWNQDGTCTIYDTQNFIEYKGKLIDENSDEYFTIPDSFLCDPKNTKIIDIQIRTVKRQGNKIITVKLWQSDNKKLEEEENKKKEDSIIAENKKLVEESEIYTKLFGELKKKYKTYLMWSFDNSQKHFMLTVVNFKEDDTKTPEHRKLSCNIKWGVKAGPIFIEFINEKEGIRHKKEHKRKMELLDEVINDVKDYLK